MGRRIDILTRKGDKVVFRRPDAGSLGEQERAKKHLIVNKVYTIERTVVSSYHTDIYLQEVKGVAFNSVQFDDVDGVSK